MSDQLPVHRLFVGGEAVAAVGGQTYESIDPATGRPWARFAAAGRADADRAIAVARQAHESGVWRSAPHAERATVLRACADAFIARQEEIVALEIRDAGSTMRKANTADVTGAAMTFHYYADLIEGQPVEVDVSGAMPVPARNLLRREPVGVVAAIVPFNFPFAAAAWKVAPALAAGCTMVLKPSPYTPASALLLAEICHEAGVPAGALNVLTGPSAELGAALVEHPDVAKVVFTGSTSVGKLVMKTAADTVKDVTLELGGKGANIICADANLEGAVPGAVFGCFFHSGQVCQSGTRVLVPRSIHDDFVAQLVEAVQALTIGPPEDFMTTIGPLISARQRDNAERYVQLAVEGGATIAVGGKRPAHMADGFYLEPTVLTGVTNEMPVACEEIFGPVMTVIAYDDEDEAIRVANDSIYGLSAAVWTADTERGLAMARKLEAGTVWVNDFHLLMAQYEFGGYKQSGIGRELGESGLRAYQQVKHIHVGEPDGPDVKYYFSMIMDAF